MQFKVGDIVKVKRGYYNAGKIGVVVDSDNWNIWIRVRFDDGSVGRYLPCLLYTSPSPRDLSTSRMPSSA